MIARMLYGPPDWLVHKFSSRDRRAFGFWTVIVAGTLAPFLGNFVWYVTVLSVIALIPNFSTETPVEEEDE